MREISISSGWAGTGEPGRICLGTTAPHSLFLGAAERAVGSQPASDFWSAPEGLEATQMCRRRICSGDQGEGWTVLGFSTSWCVLGLERECFLQCCCPVATEQLIQQHGKSRMGRQHLIRHLGSSGSAPPAVTAPVPVSLHMPCSWSISGITAGGKKRH